MELNIRNKLVQIDGECVSLVKYFNNIGLDTKHCCQGHKREDDFYIMFEDYITDEIMINFINQYANKYNHTPFLGKFVKWYRRMSGEIVSNWVYTANTTKIAEVDYMRMTGDTFKIKEFFYLN